MIVVIGDSIAAGQYLEPPGVPWPQLLNVGEVHVAAVSNDTTRQGLERFPRDVQAHEPDVVVIQFGHNDANRWETDRGLHRVSPMAFSANLHEMVDRCKVFGAVPYLCSITPSRKSERHALDCKEYDKILREVAKRRGTPIIDVYEWFTTRANQSDDLLLPDGLHLSGAGHRLYAAAVASVLA